MNIRKRFILPLFFAAAFVACNKPVPAPQPEPEPTPSPEPEPQPAPVYDGSVAQIRTATKGKGLDIVMMGDGFVEEDFANGTYDRVMETACQHLFSVEPQKSLEEYFNVYTVGVVSANRDLDGTSGLKCKGVNPTEGVTQKIVDSYGALIPEIAVDSTVFCIIMNSRDNGGWTSHDSYKTQKGYAFSPMIKSSSVNHYYRLCLIHETFGHAFAKMGDEYVMSGYAGKAPGTGDRRDLEHAHKCGFDLNICYSKDPEECTWKEFLEDERYSTEQIGFYEGTGYFGKGSYHPTKTNMMNTTYGAKMEFSAPQRKIIYDRVIRRAEGRTPDYEEFVTFDKKNN